MFWSITQVSFASAPSQTSLKRTFTSITTSTCSGRYCATKTLGALVESLTAQLGAAGMSLHDAGRRRSAGCTPRSRLRRDPDLHRRVLAPGRVFGSHVLMLVPA